MAHAQHHASPHEAEQAVRHASIQLRKVKKGPAGKADQAPVEQHESCIDPSSRERLKRARPAKQTKHLWNSMSHASIHPAEKGFIIRRPCPAPCANTKLCRQLPRFKDSSNPTAAPDPLSPCPHASRPPCKQALMHPCKQAFVQSGPHASQDSNTSSKPCF